MSEHEVYMRRCLELANRGIGNVSPNPMVGAVVVHDHKIVAEGWHQVFGGPHAEPNALSAMPLGVSLAECTLYVNLEPCAHYGKTPPCARLLIEKGIGKVVIGSIDPNPQVNGHGIDMLREAGILVETGILKDDCDALNKRFFTFQNLKRPYIILKWACTADGYMGPENRERLQISGEESRIKLHQWRGQEDAVLIGVNTAIMDNPILDTRLFPGKNPVRIVIDPNLRAPKLQGNLPTLVLNSLQNKSEDNCTWLQLSHDFAVNDILNALFEKNITSVLVEGGAETLKRFIESGFYDEVRIIRSKNIRIEKGIDAPETNMNMTKTEETATDIIQYYGKGDSSCG